MKGDDLEKNLARLRRSPVPEPPGDLASRVWRSIREAEARAPREWIPSFWPDWIVRPAFAVALVMATFGAGVILGTSQGDDRWAVVSAGGEAVHLDAFEVGGHGSPYGRLFYRQ